LGGENWARGREGDDEENQAMAKKVKRGDADCLDGDDFLGWGGGLRAQKTFVSQSKNWKKRGLFGGKMKSAKHKSEELETCPSKKTGVGPENKRREDLSRKADNTSAPPLPEKGMED